MPRRPCLTPGCSNLTPGTPRCPTHQRHNSHVWAKTSATILEQWRATHGDWCPGYQRDPHSSADLTVHHTDRPHQPYTVLCRPCNAAAG